MRLTIDLAASCTLLLYVASYSNQTGSTNTRQPAQLVAQAISATSQRATSKTGAARCSSSPQNKNVKDLQNISKVFDQETDKYYKNEELNERKLK